MEKQSLSAFVQSLQHQGVNIQSVTAANIFSGTPSIEVPEVETKVQLHDKLVELGLKTDSPLFNRAWITFHPTLKLR